MPRRCRGRGRCGRRTRRRDAPTGASGRRSTGRSVAHLEHHVDRGGVAPGRQRPADVDHPHPQRVDRPGGQRRGVGDQAAQRVVGRGHASDRRCAPGRPTGAPATGRRTPPASRPHLLDRAAVGLAGVVPGGLHPPGGVAGDRAVGLLCSRSRSAVAPRRFSGCRAAAGPTSARRGRGCRARTGGRLVQRRSPPARRCPASRTAPLPRSTSGRSRNRSAARSSPPRSAAGAYPNRP